VKKVIVSFYPEARLARTPKIASPLCVPQGTRQSGALNFRLANISEDRGLLELAREYAEQILEADHRLEMPVHLPLKQYLQIGKAKGEWSKIS
jgi:ATP-dependent DNA helicase RecG